MPVVELAGVTKAYESKVAVRDLSLSIEAGQMFGLLGPNGAGKTSSIRMMMGITLPDSGRISLFGMPFDRRSLDRVGYLPDERGLYKKMNVLEQLVFFGQLHGVAQEDARKRAIDWTKRMEISGRQSAMGIPGKPAPEPKSSSVAIPAGSARAQAIDSTKWRRRIPSSSRIAVRFMRAFQRRRSER